MATRRRIPVTKTETKKKPSTMDIFAFRDMLREIIKRDHKSFRAFAIEKEKELGYAHSNTLMSISSSHRRPSAKVLDAIAKTLGVEFKKEREIVETYKVTKSPL